MQSHYAVASLSRQFDALLWFDKTQAVTEIGPGHARTGITDTYPFGVQGPLSNLAGRFPGQFITNPAAYPV